MHDAFRRFAHQVSLLVGSPWAFLLALGIIVAWAGTGPVFGFSDTWQLVINTGTTVVTFLVVFIIQNTQNRDARAMHLKLDELLRAVVEARTDLVELEELSDAELERLHEEFHQLHLHYAKQVDQVSDVYGRRHGRRLKPRKAPNRDS